MTLVELFGWSEEEFKQRLVGSPIRRIGHERWLRNIAVALGNALRNTARRETMPKVVAALERRSDCDSALVREHIAWALAQAPTQR